MVMTRIRTPTASAVTLGVLCFRINYAPGAVDTIHRHDAHAVVYVLEGEVEMQVRGGMLRRLGPGQVFYESPEDVHTVSRNASKTKPAKFVVFFIKNEGAPILIPIH